MLDSIKEIELLADLSEYTYLKLLRSKCYDILPNHRYIDEILELIHSTLKSAKALKTNIKDIELKQWLLFQSDGERGYARGNMNIRLIDTHHVRVLTLDYDKRTRYVKLDLNVPKEWKKLIEVLVNRASEGLVGYPARVAIRDYGIGKTGLHVHGEVQLMILYMLYLEVMRRYLNPKSDNIAGVDVNVERLLL